jgi:hypothetical protein
MEETSRSLIGYVAARMPVDNICCTGISASQTLALVNCGSTVSLPNTRSRSLAKCPECNTPTARCSNCRRSNSGSRLLIVHLRLPPVRFTSEIAFHCRFP